MLRYVITLLMLFFTVSYVYAGSESLPGPDGAQKGSTLYLHTHVISTYYDKEMRANNHLVISNKDAKEMNFLMTAIANENHECVLEGKATRVDDGRYEYRENKCLIFFVFDQDQVSLQVTGANGNFCRCDDLRAGHGCGFNTSIDSATYKKAKKPARSHSR